MAIKVALFEVWNPRTPELGKTKQAKAYRVFQDNVQHNASLQD